MTKFYSTWRTHLGALLLMMTVFSFNVNATIHEIPSDADSLEHFIETDYDTAWFAGDTIMLSDDVYTLTDFVSVNVDLVIMGNPDNVTAPLINLQDAGFLVDTVNSGVSLTMQYLKFDGEPDDNGDYSEYVAGVRYNTNHKQFGTIKIEDVEAYGCKTFILLPSAKGSIIDSLIMNNILYHDQPNNTGATKYFVIQPYQNTVKYGSVTNSTFYNIAGGFMDCLGHESVTGTKYDQNWTIDHNTFYNLLSYDRSLISLNDITDESVTMNFTNNIVSTFYDSTRVRPFLLSSTSTPGTLNVKYNTFHDFSNGYYSGALTIYNLDSVAAKGYIDTAYIYRDYPAFADTANYDFTLSDTSYAYTAASDGGPLGDPRWSEKIIKVVSISALLETVITGNDYQMEATVNVGDSIDDGTVTWSVLNGTGYATIDANGLLSADTAGKVTVIATSNYKSIYADSLDIIIRDTTFVSGISLTGLETDMITETTAITNSGNSIYIKASVSPGSATNDSVTWAISDESLATFTESSYKMIKLTATGIACGTVTVTATAKDGSGISGTIDISLEKQVSATSVALSSESTTVAVGGTLQILSDFLPAATCDQTLTWTSTDEDVATVDSTGIVTGVAEGTADIIARTSNYKKDTITITVGTSGVNSDLESTNTISVYPNPATDIISINNESAAKVNITNLVGRIVLTETIDPNATINISSLKSGIYFISIETTDKINSVRFIKK